MIFYYTITIFILLKLVFNDYIIHDDKRFANSCSISKYQVSKKKKTQQKIWWLKM